MECLDDKMEREISPSHRYPFTIDYKKGTRFSRHWLVLSKLRFRERDTGLKTTIKNRIMKQLGEQAILWKESELRKIYSQIMKGLLEQIKQTRVRTKSSA